MLDEIYQKLLEGAAESSYDKEGKPTYSLGFYGTKEEIEEIKRKLSEIESSIHEKKETLQKDQTP